MQPLNLINDEFTLLAVEVLGQGGCLRFEARGGSMFPFVRHGDVLTVQPMSGDALRSGDIALYRSAEGRLVAHRIVGLRKMEGGQMVLAMRGDAAPGAGEQVPAEQVLGRVVSVQRGSKLIRPDGTVPCRTARLWIGLLPLGPTGRIGKAGRAALWFFRRLQAWKPLTKVNRF